MYRTPIQIELIEHLQANALYTEGPYKLSSGIESDWYLDGRQTTFDGAGARIVGSCVLEVIDPRATAVGGLTMGADPIAVATAILSTTPLQAFSVRKEAKAHGTGGRLVGPVVAGDRAVVVEDTVTTGGSMASAIEVLKEEGIEVVQAIVLVDRSDGAAARLLGALGVPLVSVLTPHDLGVIS
ncbi:MAG: orotate phosphoribosyltransferase [Acidimicrobiia bacterium]|nr:orotate phosphoribosyltransferase [Acidimicrobiia bacterium]MDX2467861.1 orotate phosphoribosyltransferase [Acidimicrobiia bacterium]